MSLINWLCPDCLSFVNRHFTCPEVWGAFINLARVASIVSKICCIKLSSIRQFAFLNPLKSLETMPKLPRFWSKNNHSIFHLHISINTFTYQTFYTSVKLRSLTYPPIKKHRFPIFSRWFKIPSIIFIISLRYHLRENKKTSNNFLLGKLFGWGKARLQICGT